MKKTQLIESFFRFCPHCGTENADCGSVPFRCGECGFAHFFGPVAAVGALITNEQAELLLVRRARDPGKGKWGLPGGFVDRDESVEQGLAREVLEETNLRITQCDYLTSHPNHYDYRGIVAPVLDMFYLCQVKEPAEIQLEVEELEHHQWVRPTDAHLQNMAFESNRLAIEQWLSISRK